MAPLPAVAEVAPGLVGLPDGGDLRRRRAGGGGQRRTPDMGSASGAVGAPPGPHGAGAGRRPGVAWRRTPGASVAAAPRMRCRGPRQRSGSSGRRAAGKGCPQRRRPWGCRRGSHAPQRPGAQLGPRRPWIVGRRRPPQTRGRSALTDGHPVRPVSQAHRATRIATGPAGPTATYRTRVDGHAEASNRGAGNTNRRAGRDGLVGTSAHFRFSHLAPWWGRPAGRENGVGLARDVDVFLATRPLISLAPGSDQKGRALFPRGRASEFRFP